MNKERADGLREAAEIVKRLGTLFTLGCMDSNAKEAYEEIIKRAEEIERQA